MPPKQVSIELGLEQQRLRLEESVANLRFSLATWRNWSAEYEAFREELQELPEDVSRDDMLVAGISLEGDLLKEPDVKDLLGDKLGVKRSRNQTIKAIGDRIQYVDKNIKTVEKKLDQEEAKLEKVLIVSNPVEMTEEGLPLMAIEEELDEDGNVISATVNGKNPDDAVRNIDTSALGDFEKFIDEEDKVPEEPTPKPNTVEKETEPKKLKEEPAAKARDVLETVKERVAPTPASAPTQSSDGKNSRITELADDSDEEEFMKHETGGFVKVVSDPEIPESQWPDNVAGESAEEAALRKEMLQYNMSEIGHVVAELNLEEDGDYYGYESYSDEEDSEASEEEDEYGRTTKRVVTDSYRREMEELQQMIKEREEKMAAKSTNKEKAPLPKPQPEAPTKPVTKSTTSEKPVKKGVRFAEELDISPAPKQFSSVPQAPISATASFTTNNDTFSDIIPADDDALPYLTELMARTGMYNAGPHEPVFPNPDAVEAEEMKLKGEKTPSILKQTPSTSIKPTEKSTAPAAPAPKPSVSTVADTVLERAPTTAPSAPSLPQLPKKISRFRAARAATSTSDDEAETEKSPQPLMAHSVIEHAPNETATKRQKKPSELDPDIHRKEVAERMVKLRGKMAARNGGYAKEVEDEEDELRRNDGVVMLDENGEEVGREEGGRKMSRFKMARMKALR